MQPTSSQPIPAPSPRFAFPAFIATAVLAATAATAQVASGIDASGDYQREMQACMSGRTQQDQATCLKEARNAQSDRSAKQANPGQPQADANASQRCNVFQGEEKAACEARVLGYGGTSGSVAGGGVIREVETVVVPAGSSSVTMQPKTPEPVVLVPVTPTK